MPLERARVDQLPLPSLPWYAGFSGLALFYVVVYALMSPEGPTHTLESEIWCTAVSLARPCMCIRGLLNAPLMVCLSQGMIQTSTVLGGTLS